MVIQISKMIAHLKEINPQNSKSQKKLRINSQNSKINEDIDDQLQHNTSHNQVCRNYRPIKILKTHPAKIKFEKKIRKR